MTLSVFIQEYGEGRWCTFIAPDEPPRYFQRDYHSHTCYEYIKKHAMNLAIANKIPQERIKFL